MLGSSGATTGATSDACCAGPACATLRGTPSSASRLAETAEPVTTLSRLSSSRRATRPARYSRRATRAAGGGGASHVSPDPAMAAVAGAGPAGLAAGFALSEAGWSVQVFEQAPLVGGLARTLVRDGFRFDIGGHRWFTK